MGKRGRVRRRPGDHEANAGDSLFAVDDIGTMHGCMHGFALFESGRMKNGCLIWMISAELLGRVDAEASAALACRKYTPMKSENR
jgi:hypothetical protein